MGKTIITACSVENCNDPHCAKGFCVKHYFRWKRGTSFDAPYRKTRTKAKCRSASCKKLEASKGFCKSHYYRHWLKKETVTPIKELHFHGMTNTPEYQAWRDMRDRTSNPKSKSFHYYGGRGIKVCEQWKDDFLAFYEHIGPRPSKHHSLDRIDNNGNYEPGNVRWATLSQQNSNKRPKYSVMKYVKN